MKPKYTEPCPHCGQGMARKPTTYERAQEFIVQGISKTYTAMRDHSYWPGSISIAAEVMQSMSDNGIRVVEDAAMANEFGRGYVAGLEAARALCQNVGSPATAQITATIADWKEKNK